MSAWWASPSARHHPTFSCTEFRSANNRGAGGDRRRGREGIGFVGISFGSESAAESGRGVSVVGADAFRRTLLARGDVRASESATAVLGVASEGASAQGGLVAGGGGGLGDRCAVGNVELAA